MMKNYDESVKINHNPNCPYNSDHPYRIFISSSLGSGKTNARFNLIKYHRLIKFIYASKIHSSQTINYLLMEERK